jgi:hypothetical protein
MDQPEIAHVLFAQDGVISRHQFLDHGGNDNDIERLLRRRVWARVHPGVYVEHTGPLTPTQREWAAVLFAAPAALTGWSALSRHGVRSGSDRAEQRTTVEIAVDHGRAIVAPPGVRVVRMRRFDERVQLHLSPPRIRLEHAVLDACASTDELGAVAVVADACRSRLTTPARLLLALEDRPRLRHRALLSRILVDVAAGTHSVLEWMYLTRVERPHRLPVASRQRTVRVGRAAAYRDVEYRETGTIVELDGRLGHELAVDRWADLTRDVEAATGGELTVRLGWRQVLDPCRTAAAVAKILVARGWASRPTPCSDRCPAGSWVGFPASYAGRPTRSAT